MDLDTFLTTLYVRVDDWYKAEIADQIGRRKGPAPRMSDSEVLTVALAGQWRGHVPWGSERGVVRYMQQHGRGWFPDMLGPSRFNQRVRDLWAVFIRLQQAVADWLGTAADLYEIVDCVPLPACSAAQARRTEGHWLWWSTFGRGGNQGRWYWGEKVLMSISPTGVIRGWLLGPAHTDDRYLMQALVSQRAGQCELHAPQAWRPWRTLHPPSHVGPLSACGAWSPHPYIGDKGFNGIRWQTHWRQHYAVDVIAAPSVGMHRAWSSRWHYWIKRLRQMVETTFANLAQVFSWQRLRAHSRWGQYTRIAIACAAHNLGILFNRQLGRPDLSHATLIC